MALQKRIEMLAKIVHSRSPRFWADDRSADVEENIAYSGTPTEDDGESER
nr:hypothetical protein [Evansella caseinilytica]